MDFIPKVKEMEIGNGFLVKKAIRFSEKHLDSRLVAALNKLPCESDGVRVEVCLWRNRSVLSGQTASMVGGTASRVQEVRQRRAAVMRPFLIGGTHGLPFTNRTSEGYELNICEDHISIRSSSTVEGFYAIQTLRQLFKKEAIPCLYILLSPKSSIALKYALLLAPYFISVTSVSHFSLKVSVIYFLFNTFSAVT